MYQYSDDIAFGGYSERQALLESGESGEWTVINVSKKEIEDAVDEAYHIPLNDGAFDGGNSQLEFADAVNSVRTCISDGEKVFVHCAVGQSRSVSVLATAIAAEYGQEYELVQGELMRVRDSFTEPMEELQQKAEVYLRHTRER